MLTRRLITSLIDQQIAVLSVVVGAIQDDVLRQDCDYQTEHLLRQATLGMLRACNNLSDLERLLSIPEDTTSDRE